jgi:hypothetical protein
MAGTPEEDLLGWLEREEESLGFSTVADALGDKERKMEYLIPEIVMGTIGLAVVGILIWLGLSFKPNKTKISKKDTT